MKAQGPCRNRSGNDARTALASGSRRIRASSACNLRASAGNAIEALNRQLRKAIKTKGSFPSEDAARKLIYLAIQNAGPRWTRTQAWTKALLAFKIHFGDRLPD